MKRLESLFRPWAIPNLTVIIIAGQVILFLAYNVRAAQGGGGDPFAKLYLIPSKVLEGEVWRILTFPLVPFSEYLLGAVFGWILFYMFGTTLEQQWGTIRYNMFLIIGLLANIVAAFLCMPFSDDLPADNYFLYATTFLAFARLYPDFVIHVMFILPIRIKWLALLMWIAFAFQFFQGDWLVRMLVLASLLNYFLFFGREHWNALKYSRRRMEFHAKTSSASKPLVHECRICGLNSDASPRTLFRYCSKCAGQCCYCPDHIHNHEHVLASDTLDEEAELAETGKE